MAYPTIEDFVGKYPRAGGFVYVLTNKAHPNLQKIGFTTRSPADRALELDATGNAYPFEVALACYQAEPHEAEQRLHRALNTHRVRSEREFFDIPLADAVAVILGEFGENAKYFDPLGITAAGKTRLEQIEAETKAHEAIDQRVAIAEQRLKAATSERARLERRLAEASARSDKSRANFFGRPDDADERRQVAQLKQELEELEQKIPALTAEHEAADSAWRASGGPARADRLMTESFRGLLPPGRKASLVEAMAKSAMRSVGSTTGREIVRGVLGSLLSGNRRR